jgi:hypothetical protein
MSYKDFTVNGARASFQSFRFELEDGAVCFGVQKGLKEFNWSDNVEREQPRANGPYPEGVTNGEYQAEGSQVWLAEDWDRFALRLAARGYGVYSYRGSSSCIYTRDDGAITTINIIDMMFKKRGRDNKQGPEGLLVSLDLEIAGPIFENGIGPFGERLH